MDAVGKFYDGHDAKVSEESILAQGREGLMVE